LRSPLLPLSRPKPTPGRFRFLLFKFGFFDDTNFLLYNIHIIDRTFSKVENTANFESNGKSGCAEKIYRAALKASRAPASPNALTIQLAFPSELAETASPAKKD